MRTRTLYVIGAAVAFGLIAATMASASSGIQAPRKIAALETIVQSRFVDAEPPGTSLGDTFYFSSDLTRNGTRVGHVEGQCLQAHKSPLRLRCTSVAKLDGGQLAAEGLSDSKGVQPGGGFNLAITGGTGIYENARGYEHVQTISSRKSHDTFYVIP